MKYTLIEGQIYRTDFSGKNSISQYANIDLALHETKVEIKNLSDLYENLNQSVTKNNDEMILFNVNIINKKIQNTVKYLDIINEYILKQIESDVSNFNNLLEN